MRVTAELNYNFQFSEEEITMAQRFVLNETSYHGSGAVANVAAEAKARGFRKALV